MKKALFLFFLFTTQTLFAQETQARDASPMKGKKGLVFAFNGLSLSSAGLGGKYWIADAWCVEARLWGSAYKEKEKETIRESASSRVGVSGSLSKYFVPHNAISPFVGAGLGASKEWSSWTRSDGIHSSIIYGTLNAHIFIGAEYWLNKKISLAGEQAVNFRYSFSPSSTTTDATIASSGLLLSVYF